MGSVDYNFLYNFCSFFFGGGGGGGAPGFLCRFQSGKAKD